MIKYNECCALRVDISVKAEGYLFVKIVWRDEQAQRALIEIIQQNLMR